MLDRRALQFIILLVFLLPVAAFIPGIFAETTSQFSEDTYAMGPGDSVALTHDLNLSVESISQSNADISLVDETNADGETVQLSNGDSYTFAFIDGNITVLAHDITDGEEVILDTSYPTTYGWGNNEELVHQSIPFVIFIPIFILFILIVGGTTNEFK